MATSADDVRRLVQGWPETLEQDHHGFPSFRVRGKIFSTFPDPTHLHIMIDPNEVDAAVAEAPACCQPLWSGTRLRGVRITLPAAEPGFVGELLRDAWTDKAPRGQHRPG
jgi:hypothetical protein